MRAATTQMQTQNRPYTIPRDLQWPERMKMQSMTYLKR